MNKNKLMVGDLILHKNFICRVLEIREDGLLIENQNGGYVKRIEDLEAHPIPLTQEIVLENNEIISSECDEVSWLDLSDEGNGLFEISYSTKDAREYKYNTYAMFVHQMQQAFRSFGLSRLSEKIKVTQNKQ